jgi:glycosyltransferase involved in cell wall biosynthesis
MAENATRNRRVADASRRIEFRAAGPIPEAEKPALLSFLMREFELQQPMVLKGAGSAAAARFLIEQRARFDLLYLDPAALRDIPSSEVPQLLDLLSRKGVICIESGNAAGTIDADALPAGRFESILASPGFSIFARVDGERPLRSMRYQADLFVRKLHFQRGRRAKDAAATTTPEVAVIVLAYKHEDYIGECLRSVLGQRGKFRMRLIIIDDASPDGTATIIRSIMAEKRDAHIEIDFHANTQNVGVVANLATAIRKARGCDYLTFCEGDDFWTSEDRVQKHIAFLIQNPNCAVSFKSIELCNADGHSRKISPVHDALDEHEIDGRKLSSINFMGNFSCCFYHGELIDIIPSNIFDFYTVDWFFNLYCSQFGKIGHLKEILYVYRQHSGGEWSSKPPLHKAIELLELISRYNEFLDYQYDEGFQDYLIQIYSVLDHNEKRDLFSLLMIDDIFPSPLGGPRHAELTTYLREFQDSLVLATGRTLRAIEDNSANKIVRSYRRKYPDFAGNLIHHNGDFPLRLARLVYANSLTDTYATLHKIEAAKVPFIFTLYPGAGFVLNDPISDGRLKRVFDSPYFQKVIVTQRVTHDYIVHRGLCPAEKVQMIFGAMMPEVIKEHPALAKRRWGFDKPRLDICFMAHNYTRRGEDRGYEDIGHEDTGYDVFVNVASILRQRHDDVYFHVVGPFDKRAIDVSSFSDRIKFHGSLHPEELDDFFQDMDLILSPIEAGIRGTAIFAIDEFNSAKGYFADGKDIVLIPYDLEKIVGKIESYYANPGGLKTVGERGQQRIRDLYGFAAQMQPRIALLREVIDNLVVSPNDISAEPDVQILDRNVGPTPPRTWETLRRTCPEPIKKIYRAWKGSHARH